MHFLNMLKRSCDPRFEPARLSRRCADLGMHAEAFPQSGRESAGNYLIPCDLSPAKLHSGRIA